MEMVVYDSPVNDRVDYPTAFVLARTNELEEDVDEAWLRNSPQKQIQVRCRSSYFFRVQLMQCRAHDWDQKPGRYTRGN